MRTISREVGDASLLTPQRLHAELLVTDPRFLDAYLQGALKDATHSDLHESTSPHPWPLSRSRELVVQNARGHTLMMSVPAGVHGTLEERESHVCERSRRRLPGGSRDAHVRTRPLDTGILDARAARPGTG